uniref:U81 n=2 Tax=Roseolovirus TaxID=40272 RepID=A0A1W6J7E0_9BETA|nr:U81 [Human betaherpesvirus 6]AVI08766.1 Uracil-DNA glycosylase [Human betaherpesvirus 6B]ARJ99212.1 U81 [Human betaherpesvirus 6]ARJ99328.1 U81 [Human betaherpesvirus 6]ARJ99443.1 U81 [Human betaherpesvirus 6]
MALLQWMLDHVQDEEKNYENLSIDDQHSLFGINRDWLSFLQLSKLEITHLKHVYKLVDNDRAHLTVHPSSDNVHAWSFLCKPTDVKVVILGQDPYPDGRGCGLAFGTVKECSIPESLKNIFKELERSIPNFSPPDNGCLNSWCREGVLLLNSIFTVVHGLPMSHEAFGWQTLSYKIISRLSEQMNSLVFLLWGKHARKLSYLIDAQKHLVLESAHPSPKVKSARMPFIGCNHFVRTNLFLTEHGKDPINWNILNE